MLIPFYYLLVIFLIVKDVYVNRRKLNKPYLKQLKSGYALLVGFVFSVPLFAQEKEKPAIPLCQGPDLSFLGVNLSSGQLEQEEEGVYYETGEEGQVTLVHPPHASYPVRLRYSPRATTVEMGSDFEVKYDFNEEHLPIQITEWLTQPDPILLRKQQLVWKKAGNGESFLYSSTVEKQHQNERDLFIYDPNGLVHHQVVNLEEGIVPLKPHPIASTYGGWLSQCFFSFMDWVRAAAKYAKKHFHTELQLSPEMEEELDKIGREMLGDTTYLLLGQHFEETQVSQYGDWEHKKVRITFINGILTSQRMMLENLNMLSSLHGGARIHYVFRPTEGWTWDMSRAALIHAGFVIGICSEHACALAAMWKELIAEIGGVHGGGKIFHYAHSLGGSETHAARALLTPEEQAMIHVVTFGSPFLIGSEGFGSVMNHVSWADGVGFLDPLGHFRNYYDPKSNLKMHLASPKARIWPIDHCLGGPTYLPILTELGELFLKEIALLSAELEDLVLAPSAEE